MSDTQQPMDPAVMKGVIPYVTMAGRAAEAGDFYVRAFGAKDLGRMPFSDGKPGLIHAQVEINQGALMMTDHSECPLGGDPVAHPGNFGHLQFCRKPGSDPDFENR